MPDHIRQRKIYTMYKIPQMIANNNKKYWVGFRFECKYRKYY